MMRFALLFVAILSSVSLVQSSEVAEIPRVSARVVESSTGATTLHVYCNAPLLTPQYSRADVPNVWYPMDVRRQGGYYVYSATTKTAITPDLNVHFNGVTNGLESITDSLKLQTDKTVLVTPVQKDKLSTVPELPTHIVHYGHHTIHPNHLAFARAREMARRSWMGHLGGGQVTTLFGTLWEGSGMGGPNCNTCVAQDGSAAIGDGQHPSANGSYYRSRLYRCGTVSH